VHTLYIVNAATVNLFPVIQQKKYLLLMPLKSSCQIEVGPSPI